MLDLFLTVLNMSITAGIAALLIMLLRAGPGRALPRTFSCAMWLIVLYRMICPVSFSSVFSVLGGIKPSMDIYTSTLKALSLTGGSNAGALAETSAQDLGLAPGLLQAMPTESTTGVSSAHAAAEPMFAGYVITAAAVLWGLGILTLLLYNAVSYQRLSASMNTSILFVDQQLVNECRAAIRLHRRVAVYESAKVESPFVYGLLRPRVMLPASAVYLSDSQGREQLRHILLHELNHIKRFDYLIKPLAFLTLCIHWFNPILWISFRLFDRDMEMSCDEGAVNALKTGTGEDYATTLLSMALSSNGIGKSCALAFRESNAGERVKHIVKYKKPGLTVVAASIVLIAVCVLGLLTNPISLAEELNGGRVNTLVMCKAKESEIPDTFVLLGYNDDRKEVNITFLPRDLQVLADDGTRGTSQRKLSGYASGNPPKEVMKTLSELLGVEIDHYVKVDTDHFRDIVDALGGVEFDVPIKMVYQDPNQSLNINLEKGKQVLDGKQAEMLVRFRKGYPEGDLTRIEVQKAFLGALLEQKSDIKIGTLKEIYRLLSEGMETDLGLDQAEQMIALFRSAKTVSFVDLPLQIQADDPFAPLLLDPKAMEIVKETIRE